MYKFKIKINLILSFSNIFCGLYDKIRIELEYTKDFYIYIYIIVQL